MPPKSATLPSPARTGNGRSSLPPPCNPPLPWSPLREGRPLLQEARQTFTRDDTYDEERAVEKLFRCIPKKYKQVARSIESLLDLSTMSIEEAIGHLKVVDGDEPQPLSGPITVGRKLHLTREQWKACQSDGKKGESPLSTGGYKRGKRHKSRGGAQAGVQGCAEGSSRGGAPDGAAGTRRRLPQLWQA